MRDIAVTLAVFGSLPFILRRPWIGILVWTWLGFMNPHRLAWGFSTTLPFAMIVALTTLVALLFSREQKKIPWTREMKLFVLLWAWMVVTTLAAFFPTLAWEQFAKVSKIFLMIVVAAMLIDTANRLRALVWVIAVSIGLFGVKGGIFTLMTGGAHRVLGPANTFIGNNNEIGLALVMTAPLLYYLSLTVRRASIRYALLGAVMLTVIAALGTQSRGAFLGLGATAAMLWLKSRRKIQVGILVALAVLFFLPFMPEQWHARMSTVQTYEQDASAMSRINSWWMAFNLACHRLTGGGFDSFQWSVFAMYAPNPQDNADSHSIYFQMLGHHGFPGLAIYLALVASTWFTASAVMRTAKRDSQLRWLADLMAMVQVSLFAFLVTGAFLGMAYFDYYYNLVLIVAAASVILARHRAGELSAAIPHGAVLFKGMKFKQPRQVASPGMGSEHQEPSQART